MTRHSKNNTANSVFSKAERDKLSVHYGTQRALLGSNSHRRFDACSLCLSRAVTPVTCSKGHLFCKECVMKDLLGQRDALARKKQEIEALRKEEELAKEQVRIKARELVLSGKGGSLFGKRKEREDSKAEEATSSNKKRKFEFDPETAKKLAQEAEDEAVRQLEFEQNEARKAKLPAFWLPSLTPDSQVGLLPLKDIKMQTMCHASDPAHVLLMKHLIPVKFTPMPNESSSSNKEESMCPSCQKQLSNTTNMYLMKPCSHVICKTCTDTLVKPSSQCVVCDVNLESKDIIELVREGTGFASGGRVETVKTGTAFQG
ncbi:hypothetical protein M408DRAFT_151881 [Serendipita vermifera MAFF 305830]|uniref:RING-type domain-containing protein n=1 Tax=Serendipita vermifera MAFF 305830 TaxID=933852 RepID=A0A0C3BMD8_SERVB|nr:hypothetical protein M408DRAFT_151881 [Serendipita vermifera MAFF 305830]